MIYILSELKYQNYWNEPHPHDREQEVKRRTPKSQLYLDKFNCFLFKQKEKYFALSVIFQF